MVYSIYNHHPVRIFYIILHICTRTRNHHIAHHNICICDNLLPCGNFYIRDVPNNEDESISIEGLEGYKWLNQVMNVTQ